MLFGMCGGGFEVNEFIEYIVIHLVISQRKSSCLKIVEGKTMIWELRVGDGDIGNVIS